jgi:hypothetical protein
LKNRKQKVETQEKLTPAFHRNCLILLGKLPLRQIVIKSGLLTEGLQNALIVGAMAGMPDARNPVSLYGSELPVIHWKAAGKAAASYVTFD